MKIHIYIYIYIINNQIMEYIDNIVKSNTIRDVIELYNNLIEQNYNVILVLDVDDTVLSSTYGRNFVEKDICLLTDLVYSSNPVNLLFLTARDKCLARYTSNQLNKSGLLHKGKYIEYNVLCSPYNDDGESTKGIKLVDYFTNGSGKNILCVNKKNWIIFVDDLMEHINSVQKHIQNINNTNYTLIHYRYKYIDKQINTEN